MRILLAGDSKQSWNIINVLLDNVMVKQFCNTTV